jgi:hypothetical protein
MRRWSRARIALLVAVTGVVLALLPAAANAGLLVASAPSCDNAQNEQPFATFGDSNDYFLAPGGDFETAAAGWQLGGAGVVADQEPWKVHAYGTRGLNIPAGRSAVSPTVCVGIEHPTMRFFAHRSGGNLLAAASQLVVTARVETSLGAVIEIPVGTINALTNGASWDPTPAEIVLPSLLPLLPGQHTPIQFRFTSVGTSAWVIDDVYVDPHCRG